MVKHITLVATLILAANFIFAQTATTPSEPKLKTSDIDTIYIDDPNVPGNMLMKLVKRSEPKLATFSQDTIYVDDPNVPGNMLMKIINRKDFITISGYGDGGQVDILDLPKLKELQTTLKNTKILSYDISASKGGDFFTHHIVGTEITKPAKDLILTNTKGSKIIIENILVIQEGKQKQVEPIILKVKN